MVMCLCSCSVQYISSGFLMAMLHHLQLSCLRRSMKTGWEVSCLPVDTMTDRHKTLCLPSGRWQVLCMSYGPGCSHFRAFVKNMRGLGECMHSCSLSDNVTTYIHSYSMKQTSSVTQDHSSPHRQAFKLVLVVQQSVHVKASQVQ